MRGQNTAPYRKLSRRKHTTPVGAQHTCSATAKSTADGVTSGGGGGARSGTALPAIVARRQGLCAHGPSSAQMSCTGPHGQALDMRKGLPTVPSLQSIGL